MLELVVLCFHYTGPDAQTCQLVSRRLYLLSHLFNPTWESLEMGAKPSSLSHEEASAAGLVVVVMTGRDSQCV